MTTEKQIEKIAKDICGFSCRREICIIDDKKCIMACTYARIAEKITAKGYRKASEVAEEIFADVFKAIRKYYIVAEHTKSITCELMLDYLKGDLAELKKKYTEAGSGS